jgi:hypothetical protein
MFPIFFPVYLTCRYLSVSLTLDLHPFSAVIHPTPAHHTAKDELHRMLAEDELREAVLLVFANKQDLPNAMPVNKITERLGLNTLRHRQWYALPAPHTHTLPHTLRE